jgi:hypothetical protein
MKQLHQFQIGWNDKEAQENTKQFQITGGDTGSLPPKVIVKGF